MQQLLTKLKRSKFRHSFHLTDKDKLYLKTHNINKIREHAHHFLSQRIKHKPQNDGKQTPWKGHPVFTAQHATATCCRGCIQKWYKIPSKKPLDDRELEFLREIIIAWIENDN